MKLVVKDRCVVAVHADSQDVLDRYPGCCVLTVPDGMPVEIGQSWVVDLDAAKVSARAAIDARAEALRHAVLTPGSGQMAAYQEKERQAAALLQDADPTEAKYPDIYNEVGVTADTGQDVAMAILTAAERWREYGRKVEKARLAGKRLVAEAGDAAHVIAVRDAVAWPGP